MLDDSTRQEIERARQLGRIHGFQLSSRGLQVFGADEGDEEQFNLFGQLFVDLWRGRSVDERLELLSALGLQNVEAQREAIEQLAEGAEPRFSWSD